MHSLVHCEFAQKAWEEIGISLPLPTAPNFKDWFNAMLQNQQQNLALIAMTCWAIWNNRNEIVWQARSFTVSKALWIACNLLEQWRKENVVPPLATGETETANNSKWSPPAAGKFKLNVDAAVFTNQRKCGLGFIIRDDQGSFVAARATQVHGIIDPALAEALGVREALSWLKSNFPQVHEIEMDAITVYNALHRDEPDFSYFGLIIEDCLSLARNIPNIRFLWTRRTANKAAHILAQTARTLQNHVVWSYYPPLFLYDVFDE
ncbi:uncharacterized protein A4U43_C05F5270 [Asparagus officinalis]|uniref:RNase H type-1 domain-containing protein n=1 Tax=Asparagus officinalis TaxID=4686 RepID=A0A5P1EPS3_ASPOF|nr:uncharacterized protein A4U43_C05F5270 [Asparagus officinalis]